MQPTRRSTTVVSYALLYGLLAGLVGGLWCFAGAGIYGSPFSGMSESQLVFYAGIILLGPGMALVGGLLALTRPRSAGLIYLIGGLASLVPSVLVATSDAGLLPLLLISLPMVTIGFLLRHTSATRLLSQETSSVGPQLNHKEKRSLLLGATLFLIGLVGMFFLEGYMVIENVLGFRHEPQIFGVTTNRTPDSYTLLVLLAPTLLLVPVIYLLKTRWEWLIGMWIALALGFLIVCFR